MGESKITAVLGPTNTGKTFLAVERMLGHRTGMIGFPLRLLARENYERIAAAKGAGQVALVTGEERIVPPHARWFVCTVEAMPMDREVGFLAVDEIQMVADRERGHVFTDRLLHARGRNETMFMGAETARPLIRRLVPDARIRRAAAPLDAHLHGPPQDHAPAAPLGRRRVLGRRSLRDRRTRAPPARRGGAGVRGASPRAPATRRSRCTSRATSTISSRPMRSAWASTWISTMSPSPPPPSSTGAACEGSPRRNSARSPGARGRNMSNGTFGTTAEIGALDNDVITAIEEHRFPPLTHAYWRNADLDMRTLDGLLASLDARAPSGELVRVRDADDHLALQQLSRDARAAGSRAWPRGAAVGGRAHPPISASRCRTCIARLLATVFRHLAGADGAPARRMGGQVDRPARQCGRRHRPAFAEDRGDPHLDLCVAPRRLAGRCRHASGEGTRRGRPGCRTRCTSG